jgi:hypothetical protein
MRILSIAVAAVATMLAAGGVATAEPIRLAQADISVRVGGDHHRGYHRDRGYHRGWQARGCRSVTIKERRGNRVIIKKIRRC